MLSKIPLWVFAVFVLLLLLGQRQARTRVVAPAVIAAVALGLLSLSLYGVVSAFGVAVLPLSNWILGIVAALAGGQRVFGPQGLAHAAGAVQVPGSWWPMALMLGIFTAKFALGFVTGMGLPLLHQAWFIGITALVLGMLSGGLAARALVVHRFAAARRVEA